MNTWRVDKEVGRDLPDLAFLVQQLERLETGDSTVLAARPPAGGPGRPDPERRRAARRSRSAEASDTAAVVEVRTGDRPGLLYALAIA